MPHVGEEGVLELRRARHPLLALVADEPSDVVANDVSLRRDGRKAAPSAPAAERGRGAQGLLITGANGGGKSAVLKSVGLAALLCRMAVPLPCEGSMGDGEGDYRPRVDFFSAVVADVSDSQSLQARVDGQRGNGPGAE